MDGSLDIHKLLATVERRSHQGNRPMGEAAERTGSNDPRARRRTTMPVLESERLPVGALAPVSVLDGDSKNILGPPLDVPPGDWLEPLEEDEEDEEEFSDRSSERGVMRRTRRRRQANVDDDWLECSSLGRGWRRREVLRRSGTSLGKTDTYYMSPNGDRLRSKIELSKHCTVDLTHFDFKSGLFVSNKMKRRRGEEDGVRSEHSLSSSRTATPDPDGRTPPLAASPHSNPHSQVTTPQRPRLTAVPPVAAPQSQPGAVFGSPPQLTKVSPLGVGKATAARPLRSPSLRLGDFSPQRLSPVASPGRHPSLLLPQSWLLPGLVPVSPPRTPERDGLGPPHGLAMLKTSPSFRLPPVTQLSLDPSVTLNGDSQHLGFTQIMTGCANCGCAYPGMEMGDEPLCPKCKPEKRQSSPRSIVFRKWLPCGQCRACQVTENCGVCASCRQGLLNPSSQKAIHCRRRKCLCPIRKVGQDQWVLGRSSQVKEEESISHLKKVKKLMPMVKKNATSPKAPRLMSRVEYEEYTRKKKKQQYMVSPYSDTEEYYDDDEGGQKKRTKRTCGKCGPCLRKDCGKCDFCMDKPKFGGRNKKRQKCRLRQCESHAMVSARRHLLPGQMVRSAQVRDVSWTGPPRGPGRPSKYKKRGRPLSKRSRKRRPWDDDFMDDDEEEEEDDEEEEDEDEEEERYAPRRRRRRNYSLEREEDEDEEEEEYAMDDGTSEMQQPSYIMTNEFDAEELYSSSYGLSIQECFASQNGSLEVVRSDSDPSSLAEAGQLPLSQVSAAPYWPTPAARSTQEFLYTVVGLPESDVVVTTAAAPVLPQPDALELSEDVEMVQVGTAAPEHTTAPESTPVITEIFSLADGTESVSGSDGGLLGLLAGLRHTVLPAHWVGVMAKGPLLQLLQCSKLSTMADTMLQVEPGYFYQLSVQGQPLLLTHALYERHQPRLSSVSQVVALLLDLETLSVCQGHRAFLSPRGGHPRQPVPHVRAAACQLLVPAADERCDKCRLTSEA